MLITEDQWKQHLEANRALELRLDGLTRDLQALDAEYDALKTELETLRARIDFQPNMRSSI